MSPGSSSDSRKTGTRMRETLPSPGSWRDDEDQGDETAAAPGTSPGTTTPLLRFSLPRDPQTVAPFLRTRVLRPDSEVWLTGYNALHTFVDEHGRAQVPRDATVELGDGGGTYGLGSWVSEQRRAFKAQTLRAWRADLLNEVGVFWSVGDAAFWKNLDAAPPTTPYTGAWPARRTPCGKGSRSASGSPTSAAPAASAPTRTAPLSAAAPWR
ncbi:helicase associated domain-containing protein [Streptomyces anulatus]|uniref:helicase associated domain-containing protein n=1 Tax=Streptomyces anulatus TaxID=1892 RepID=UPI001F1C4918|nr:helicase associated domain-containing protein [Streptomyces anulatus]